MNRRIVSAIILGVFCAMPALAATSDHSFTIIKRMPDWFNPPEQTDNGGGTDITAPQVTALSPTDGANDADPNASLVMTFGENVIAGSGSVNIYSDNDGLFESFDVASSSGVAVNGNQVTITPTLPLEVSTSYYVTVDAGAFRDAAGNAFAGMSTQGDWDFTTADADTNPPQAISFVPAHWSMGAAVDAPLTINFDEPVSIASGNINLVAIGDPRPQGMKPMASWSLSFDVQGGAVSVNGTEVTIAIDPENPLLADSWIGVSVDAGAFQDMAGNPSDAITPDNWAFQTAAGGGGVLACDDPLVPGCLAADGTFYVGLSPDGDVPMYVTGCDAGMIWDGSYCTGTRNELAWGTYGTTTSLPYPDANAGETNTMVLATTYGDTAAAKYCYNLDQDGYSDWYLPAQNELNAIYQISLAAGGTFRASFDNSLSYTSGYYWSSTEGYPEYNYDENYALYQIFGDGTQDFDYKTSELSVRCARKEDAAGDTTPPTIVSVTPAEGSSDFPVGDNITITFDEPIIGNLSKCSVYIIDALDSSTVECLDASSFDTNTLTLDRSGYSLLFSHPYILSIAPGIVMDVAGNSFDGDRGGNYLVNFTTAGGGGASACDNPLVPGCLAADGTVYAGLSPDGDVPMYVTRCDAGMNWDGSACADTRSALAWGTYGTVTGMTSFSAGEANTTTLATSYGDTAAAKYCYNLVENGKGDWYLPAEDELGVIFTNRVAIGGLNLSGSYPLVWYWSSSDFAMTPEGDNYAWTQNLSADYNYQGYFDKWAGLSVRCARRDGAALGMGVQQGDPAAMDIAGGSSPGANVVFTITNSGEAASGTMAVSLTGDTGNFSKTADTCDGETLAASADCSITVQPIATADGGYTGTLQVTGTPGGTVSRALSGTASGFVLPDPCAGSPIVGDVCADGTVYAGITPDGNLPMYVTRCDAGMTWDGSSCSGARSALTWVMTETGITSVITGEANTAALAAYSSTDSAGHCQNLVDISGHDDWYLPAKNELAVLYGNRAAIGGFDTSGVHPAGYYLTSSEVVSWHYKWCQSFGNGSYLTPDFYNSPVFSVRCARKDSAELGMTVPQGNPVAMDITGGSSPGANVVFTITNTGEAASGTMSVSLTGDTGNFSKMADTCDGETLAASADCSITIQPIATADGGYTGTLQVTGTPGGTVSQNLSGTASGFLLPTSLSIVPTSSVMDVVGTTQGTTAYGSAVTFTVSNCSGCQTPDVVNASLSGANFEFTGTDNCTGHTLAGGESCTLQVRAVATENGTYTGTLSVASAIPVSIADASLSGTASGFVPPDPCVGSPSPGAICSDGTVYVGPSPDDNLPMYVTRCDAGMSLVGSSCTGGTRSAITWDNGIGNYTTTGITDSETGEANTAALAVLLDAGQPYEAARYCDNLDLHGKTDWYLPAKDELNVIYTNRVAIGGLDLSGSYPSGFYWSSSETYYSNAGAWDQSLSNGVQNGGYKNHGLSVRCARR